MQRARLPLRRSVARWTLSIAERLTPAAPLVVVHSQPDLDDTALSLLRARPHDVEVVVLVDDLEKARRRAEVFGVDVPLIPRRSRAGLKAYLRARVTMSTHGLFGSGRRHARHTVGLWHGEFGKHIGNLAGEPTRHADWMPVSSPLARLARAAEFGLPFTAIADVGTPRHSMLMNPAATLPEPGLHLVWAPTFRRSTLGRARTDGRPDALADTLAPDDVRLRDLLERTGATLWFRPHPADVGPPASPGGRVLPADDRALQERGLSFYQLLGRADCLITDYSSLWVDWLLLDRAAVSYCPDLEEYRSTRGLVLEPHEQWFPGPVVTDAPALLGVLEDICEGRDSWDERRRTIAGLLHPHGRRDGAAAVWQHARAVLEEHDR